VTTLRERRRIGTRSAIVRAATDLFLERGFARTSVADIAATAGIARRTFFLHFPSKEDVLFHYLEDHVRRGVASLDDLPADATPWEGVQTAVGALVDLFADPGSRTDELAGLRTELIAEADGLPPSLVVRLQAAQRTLADALRARFSDDEAWPRTAAHLGACMGAAAGAALAVDLPDAREAAIRDAVLRAGDGFR
jgi:AcrR family transcriptional regulator